MKVVVGTLAGFCDGVKHTVLSAEEALNTGKKIYCLGEIVHNKQVVEGLKDKGLKIIGSINEAENDSSVIIRAHGEPVSTYEVAKKKNIEIIDLTCSSVKKIHDKIVKAKEDSFIILIGKKSHPEVIASISYAGNNSFIVESEDDILDAYMEYEKTMCGKVYVVSQTTNAEEVFERISKEIETNFAEADVIIDNTICLATENRQREVAAMASKYKTMVIVGGKNSSNTKELANIAKKYAQKVYLVETAEDLKEYSFNSNDAVGIMAGASTPNSSIEEVKNYLENL